MKIADMKYLIGMFNEWTNLKKELCNVYGVYERNHKRQYGNVCGLDERAVEDMVTKFLKAVASLYCEEYDEENQTVDFHLEHGIYTLVFDKNIHADNPYWAGLRLSWLVETYDCFDVPQMELAQFFEDNVGCDFRDLTIE